MPVADIKEALKDIRRGRMIILVDDEDRENEGDLTMAADLVTPEAVNFMAMHGRGLICLSLTEEKADQLRLTLVLEMVGLHLVGQTDPPTLLVQVKENPLALGLDLDQGAGQLIAAVAAEGA